MGTSVQVTPLSGALSATCSPSTASASSSTAAGPTTATPHSSSPSPDKGEGIVIDPHVSGHLLGGTVWKITKDGDDIAYAVDFNHRKEKHLNGIALGSFVRPAILITDAYNALNNQVYTRQQDQDFIGTALV